VVKINVDMGLANTSIAWIVAAVARSRSGEYLGASAVRFDGVNDPETLEAMAVHQGLTLHKISIYLSRTRVASDCF
jgi:hypothetical protein